MRADWIKARQTKYSAYVTVYILVILAVLGVANFLANRYDKSYDGTANKQFSLSDQTVKAIKGLKRDVTVTYFGETTQFPQARDLLGRYATLSPKLKVDYIDPVKKPQLARAAGVRQLGTIVVDTGERKEDAKSLTEEEITGAMIRSLKGGERNACFLAGSGEHGLDDTAGGGFSTLKEALEHNNYKTRSVNLAQPATPLGAGAAPVIGQVQQAKVEIPKDCTVLVSGGPKLAYSPAAAAAIKAFVESGGSVLVLMDTPWRITKRTRRFSHKAIRPTPSSTFRPARSSSPLSPNRARKRWSPFWGPMTSLARGAWPANRYAWPAPPQCQSAPLCGWKSQAWFKCSTTSPPFLSCSSAICFPVTSGLKRIWWISFSTPARSGWRGCFC